MPTNARSDKEAVAWFIKELERRGYNNVVNAHRPVDITADKDDRKYYFEIKYTEDPKRSFGAATLTEWECAIDNPETFRFVIVQNAEGAGQWVAHEFKLTEFMQHTRVPPIKFYFNVNLDGEYKPSKLRSGVRPDGEMVREIVKFYEELKKSSS